MLVGNDTFYVNVGYLATLSPLIAEHAHHPDHDFLGGELPLSTHLEPSDIEVFLHVVYPSEKPINGRFSAVLRCSRRVLEVDGT